MRPSRHHQERPKVEDHKEKNVAAHLEPNAEKKEITPEEKKSLNVEENKPENAAKGIANKSMPAAASNGVSIKCGRGPWTVDPLKCGLLPVDFCRSRIEQRCLQDCLF